jgi:hypothetical protein
VVPQSALRQLTGLDEPSSEEDRLIERVDAGESTIPLSEPMEEAIHFKQPLDRTIAVRLSDRQWQELYAEAKELGVGPSTLVRMWALEKLRERRRERQPT